MRHALTVAVNCANTAVNCASTAIKAVSTTIKATGTTVKAVRTAVKAAAVIATSGLTACTNHPMPLAPPAPPPVVPAGTSLTATTILTRLVAARVGVGYGFVQDATTDPDRQLGQPGEYTSRASFDLPEGDRQAQRGDTGRGGVLEVFDTAADATRRARYLGGSVIAECDFLHGPVVLRIDRHVPTTRASDVDSAVAAIVAELIEAEASAAR